MRSRGVLALAAWCFFLGASLWALDFADRGDLAAPPLGNPSALLAWTETVGLASAVVSCARLIALVCAWYLLAITLLGAMVRVAGSCRVKASVDLVTPKWLLPLLEAAGAWTAASLTLVGTPLIAASVGAGGPAEQPVSTTSVPVQTSPTTAPSGVHSAQSPVLPSPTASGRAAPAPKPSPAPTDAPAPPSGSDSTAHEAEPPATWTVAPGDHFWRIAAETIAESMTARPQEHEVAAYWLHVIESNRDRLVVPDNPDLLYPGQVLVLPPVGEGDQPGV